jgi:hypothetical protein
VIAGLAGGDDLAAGRVARVLDAVAAAGGDPGGQGGERDEDCDRSCQFFESDSKNLTGMRATVRTKCFAEFIEFVY